MRRIVQAIRIVLLAPFVAPFLPAVAIAWLLYLATRDQPDAAPDGSEGPCQCRCQSQDLPRCTALPRGDRIPQRERHHVAS